MRRIGLVVLALLAGTSALWWGFSHFRTAPWRPALSSREIATRVLAEHLAKQYPGVRTLVLGNPFTLRSGQGTEIYAFERAGVQGLHAGFRSSNVVKVVYPKLRPEFLKRPETVYVDPKTKTPLSFLVAEDSLEQLALSNPDFDLIVSLIGLPVNVRQSRWWNQADKPHFALLLPDWRIIGDRSEIRQAFRSGKVAAAVISRPGGAPEDEPIQSSDYQAEFGRRFLLVTTENFEELLRTNPRLF